MRKTLVIDGFPNARMAYGARQDGNGLPLVPQLLLPANPRRVLGFVSNESGTLPVYIGFGDPSPAEGMAGSTFAGSVVLAPGQTLILEWDADRGACEWTGSIWSNGRSVGLFVTFGEIRENL